MNTEIFTESTFKYYATYIFIEIVLLCLSYVMPKAIWKNAKTFVEEKIWWVFPLAFMIIYFIVHSTILLGLSLLTMPKDDYIAISKTKIHIHRKADYDFLFNKIPAQDIDIMMHQVKMFKMYPKYNYDVLDEDGEPTVTSFSDLVITYQKSIDADFESESITLDNYDVEEQFRMYKLLQEYTPDWREMMSEEEKAIMEEDLTQEPVDSDDTN